MIKNFTPRLYQETILATCTEKNTLVVLPTGMGKTFIFLMLSAYRLRQYPNSKILFIGPTRPLIEQYHEVFLSNFEIEPGKLAMFTGHVSPEKRAELWKNAQIIFSTPQGLENDIINNKINLEDVSLLGIDEAHRAVGDYSYVFLAKQYQKKSNFPRILALTASPGSEIEHILEVCKNLYIEDIEIRTSDDPDVRPYVKDIEIEWIKVALPEDFMQIHTYLSDFLNSRLERLRQYGILRESNLRYLPKRDLLALQGQLTSRISSGEKNSLLWNSISILAEIMKIYHALELLETQGIKSLYNYLDKLHKESYNTKVKAVKSIAHDLNFRSALIKTKNLYEQNIRHPKLISLCGFIRREVTSNPNIKLIVFNHYRDNASEIVNELNKISGIKANLFVGQAKKADTGLSQKEQKSLIEDFRNNLFNALCCTSVGEEGLDIPKVDLVIFYEPIPSAIRHIQRRGRTGRQEKGRVVVFMTLKTRDEVYKFVAHRKEKMMIDTLSSLRIKLREQLSKEKVSNLNKYIKKDKPLRIVADYREKGSDILRSLFDADIEVKLEMLQIADYILSERVAVEVKTVNDFIVSILDGRLLEQLKNLRANYERPIIILQGSEDIYSARNLHPNAIRGMLATIFISYGIPIIKTSDPKDTAEMLMAIAKREQEDSGQLWSLHPNKRLSSVREMQEYIISSLPGVGHALAKPLLKEFGTIKNVMNATKDRLEEVEMIGPKKASKITEVINSKYDTEERQTHYSNTAKDISSNLPK